MRLLDGITDTMGLSLSELQELEMDMGSQRVRHVLATKQQQKMDQSMWRTLPCLKGTLTVAEIKL